MSQAAIEGAFVLGGRYALSDRIAQGGMAVVWRGLDLRLHREVAIKVLTQRDEGDRDRVIREARLLAATPHPNVVQVLDVGVDAGRPFIVMELLEGTGLDRILGRGSIPATDALEIVAAALDGLAVVHARGIVHRDLKPSNLFLARDPGSLEPNTPSLLSGRRVKILDFGVSRATDRTTPMKSALTTREGALVGTPEYMAPEQARGLPEIGPAADLYALGVILFECLTGKLPFESPNAGDLIIAIATQAPPRLDELRPDLPPSVAALVHRALAKKPEERFESAQAMRKVVEAVRNEIEGSSSARVSHETIARADRSAAITLDAPPTPAPSSLAGAELPTSTSRTGLIAAVAVAGVLALVGLGYVATQSGEAASPPAPTADPTPTTDTVPPTTESAPTVAAMPTTTEVEPVPQTAPDAGAAAVAESETPRRPRERALADDAPRGTGARADTPAGHRTQGSSGGSAETSTQTPATEGTPRFRDLDY
jgi:serine/threonine protein kinase